MASAAVPLATTLHVRDTCLCLHAQRAARALAARFDQALRPAGLTNGQFSLLNALNGPEPQTLGAVAALLRADRTTLTAALKPLSARGLVDIGADGADRRIHRIALTARGHARLTLGVALWRAAHEALESELDGDLPGRMRHDLSTLSAAGPMKSQTVRRFERKPRWTPRPTP